MTAAPWRSLVGWQLRTRWPGRISRSSGLCSVQPSLRFAYGQRGAKRQASGSPTRSGGRPAIAVRRPSRPDERARDFPHQLSGGMRQRVMIAMAIANRPKLLIADEPTTALDVTIQAQVLEVLADAQRTTAAAMLLITHDLGVVAGRADRVVVMYAGRIVEEGTLDEVFGDPRHPYTRALLASVPRSGDVERGQLPTIPGVPPSLIDLPPGCALAPRCAYAVDQCRAERPELMDVRPGTTHRAACFRSAELPAYEAT